MDSLNNIIAISKLSDMEFEALPVCLYCKEKFQPDNPRQLYCCMEHRKAMRNSRYYNKYRKRIRTKMRDYQAQKRRRK